jgi:glutamine amidotransferase
MCRLAAYMGPEIFISSLVTEPRHSLIHQSYHAKERSEPLNGDGFGIGWYASPFCDAPAIFKEVSPAWNNPNLTDISRVTKSTCIFAHVRAATIGGQISRSNCHPFSWRNYLFMHNGTVHGFDKIERKLRESLSEEAYSIIKGNTDSEHLFALFVDRIGRITSPTLQDLEDSLRDAIVYLESLKISAGVTTPSSMNLVLSDGSRILATRYISGGGPANSLYISSMGQFNCEDGMCKIAEGEKAILIVSEPLVELPGWEMVEPNHLVTVDQDKCVTIKPL